MCSIICSEQRANIVSLNLLILPNAAQDTISLYSKDIPVWCSNYCPLWLITTFLQRGSQDVWPLAYPHAWGCYSLGSGLCTSCCSIASAVYWIDCTWDQLEVTSGMEWRDLQRSSSTTVWALHCLLMNESIVQMSLEQWEAWDINILSRKHVPVFACLSGLCKWILIQGQNKDSILILTA